MRKTRRALGNMKKRGMAIGLAVVMMFGMTMPAYAYDTYHMNLDDFTNDNVSDSDYVGDWFGTFEVNPGDGTIYRLEITPCWNRPDLWYISTARFLPEQSYAATMWSSWAYEDPSYNRTDLDDAGNITTLYIGDKEDPDAVFAIGKNSITNEIFAVAEPANSRVLKNEQMDMSVQQGLTGNDSFAKASDGLGYKQITNNYYIFFSGDYPDWLMNPDSDWRRNGNTSLVNWQIQSQTPVGQPPLTTLPLPYSVGGDDGDGVG